MLRPSSRVVTLAASLLLVLVLQSLPAPRAAGDDLVGNLMGQVLALQARLELVEDQVKKLQRDPVFEGSLTLNGVDGHPILQVRDDLGNATLTLGMGGLEANLQAGNVAALKLGAAGDSGLQASISVEDDVQLLLGLQDGMRTYIRQKTDAGEMTIGQEGGKQARLTMDTDGGELVLGESTGHLARLVVRDDFSELLLGQESGRLAQLKEGGDGGKLIIGNATAPSVNLEATGDGGTLTVGKQGSNAITLKQQGGDGKITIGPSGAAVVTLAAAGKGGELYFGTAEGKSVNLATNENGGQLELGKNDGTRVQIGTVAADQAIVQVAVGDRRASLQSGSEIVGMLSQGDDGAGQFGSFKGGFGMLLMEGSTRLAMLGLDDGDDAALQLYGTGGNEPTVVLQGQGEGGKLYIGKGGDEAAINLKTNGSNDSQLLMGKSGSPHVEIVAAQAETSLLVVDGNNKAGTFSDGSQLKVYAESGGDKVELGKAEKGWGLILSQAQQLAAALSTLEGRVLALRMYDKGNQVGAFGAAPDGSGGTLRVYSGGEKATVSLGGSDGAGYVTVADAGGNPIVGLDAAEALVAIYNTGGTAIASLSKASHGGGGNVTARDNGGVGVFSAGAASDGGGEACVGRQNGKVYCLGIGLPGMGTGN